MAQADDEEEKNIQEFKRLLAEVNRRDAKMDVQRVPLQQRDTQQHAQREAQRRPQGDSGSGTVGTYPTSSQAKPHPMHGDGMQGPHAVRSEVKSHSADRGASDRGERRVEHGTWQSASSAASAAGVPVEQSSRQGGQAMQQKKGATSALDILQSAIRTGHETEQVANHTLTTLHAQNEQLVGMEQNLDQMGNSLRESKRELKSRSLWGRLSIAAEGTVDLLTSSQHTSTRQEATSGVASNPGAAGQGASASGMTAAQRRLLESEQMRQQKASQKQPGNGNPTVTVAHQEAQLMSQLDRKVGNLTAMSHETNRSIGESSNALERIQTKSDDVGATLQEQLKTLKKKGSWLAGAFGN